MLDAVLEREATRTTGIGNGLAIPHGKCSGTDHLVMAIGRPQQPIDFQAIDGRPVNLIWLLATPPDKTGPHIHALARISRLMTIDKFRQALSESHTPQEMFDAIVKQENAPVTSVCARTRRSRLGRAVPRAAWKHLSVRLGFHAVPLTLKGWSSRAIHRLQFLHHTLGFRLGFLRRAAAFSDRARP